jgi:pimeloyl-ACP methyl ester carboxylesterase
MSHPSIAGLALCGILAVAGCSAAPGASSPSVAPSTGATQAPLASIVERPKELDELIDVGGRRLHIFCFGEAPAGVPTVVAESGLGGSSFDWRPILYGVAAKTRICVYDRAGLGTSDPASEPVRTGGDMADDLHAMLRAAQIDGPYVFVSHSMGIWIVSLYAKAHPENVLGVVVVDPRGAEVSANWLAALPAEVAGESEELAFVRSDLTDFEGDPTQNDDHLDLVAASREVAAVLDPPDLLFGDKPVVVLSAANTADDWSDLPEALQTEFGRIWFDAQKAIAAESTNGTFVTVEGSGHEIQFDQPEIVVTQILDVVDQTGG